VRIDVAPTADAVVAADLGGVTALIIDVLRASTTIITALSNGCDAVVPVANPQDARQRAAETPNGTALVAGERQGEPIPGFDLSNSPVEFQSPHVRGKTVFFTTSNGTRALLAARAAEAIGITALVNVTAAAAWAAGAGRDVTIVCAGSHGKHSLEDWTCGGLAVERILAAMPTAVLTDAARDALETGRRYAADVGRLKQDAPWARRLIAAGRAADVDVCLRLDTTKLVPRYVAKFDKIVGDHR
jgi:2-phosphosulfolactate phosphatase